MSERVGRYQILERLSGDAHEDVFKAFDPMIERHLVLTTFTLGGLEPAAASAVRQAFFLDMQRVGLLAHPGIAALFDAGDTPRGLFLATEFVEGISLADHLEAGVSLSFDERVSVVVQLSDAIEYAREQGVPHLHLKPTNILVGADFTPKIRGFGVASILDASRTARQDADEVSASAWLAPERSGVTPVAGDSRADVYGLARIAQRLLADVPADRSEAFERVIERATAVWPGERFATALDFKYGLLLALGLDEFDIRASWEATREATTVQLAETSSLAGLPHSAVQGDLTVLTEPTHITPSGVEELTKLQPAETVIAGDDPPEPK